MAAKSAGPPRAVTAAPAPMAKRVEKPPPVSTKLPEAAPPKRSPRSDDIDLSEVLLQMTSLLECPVCLELATSPVYQCVQGHVACHRCIKRLNDRCAVCRAALTVDRSFIRNRIAEQLAERFAFECSNLGCGKGISYTKYERHVREDCEHRLMPPQPAVAAAPSLPSASTLFDSPLSQAPLPNSSLNIVRSVPLRRDLPPTAPVSFAFGNNNHVTSSFGNGLPSTASPFPFAQLFGSPHPLSFDAGFQGFGAIGQAVQPRPSPQPTFGSAFATQQPAPASSFNPFATAPSFNSVRPPPAALPSFGFAGGALSTPQPSFGGGFNFANPPSTQQPIGHSFNFNLYTSQPSQSNSGFNFASPSVQAPSFTFSQSAAPVSPQPFAFNASNPTPTPQSSSRGFPFEPPAPSFSAVPLQRPQSATVPPASSSAQNGGEVEFDFELRPFDYEDEASS